MNQGTRQGSVDAARMFLEELDKDQLMDLGKEVLSKAMLEMDGKVLLEQGKYMLQH